MTVIKNIIKAIPSLLLSFVLAIAVWVAAVSEADPTEEKSYPKAVSIEIIGQDPGLLITNNIPSQISLTIRAPQSIWQKLTREQVPVRAIVDLSSLSSGLYDVPVQVQVGIQPAKIVSYSPKSLSISLETVSTRILPIHLVRSGDVAVGFEAGEPLLSQTNVSVTGPESRIRQVEEIRAAYKLNNADKTFTQSVPLQALDSNQKVIEGVTISPANVNVSQDVTQRGGFRNVVVKVNLKGQVASGYRITNISVYPPVITVYSSDQQRVDELPGYVDTAEMVLTNGKDDIDERLGLNLPMGITVVGEQYVQVHVSVSSIESSVTLSAMPIEVTGLDNSLTAKTSPETVDVIISGPVPLLEKLTSKDVHVVIDMSGATEGATQQKPSVELKISDLEVQSILPGSVEVTIIKTNDLTPTVAPRLPTATLTPQPVK